MKKFAYITHIGASYSKELAALNRVLGWLPDSFYRYILSKRPLDPFLWSEISITKDAAGPEGYVIMLPYAESQIREQPAALLPCVEKAVLLAKSLGAEIVGLGALTSEITLGGKLLGHHTDIAVTNGDVFSAATIWRKVSELMIELGKKCPVIAIVGADGDVGNLVSTLLARHRPNVDYLLIANNKRSLMTLALEMHVINAKVHPRISQNMDDVKAADIVVLLKSSGATVLDARHLKRNAIVLDETVPRNIYPSFAYQRPDVKIVDGGLVGMHYIKQSRNIGLPAFTSNACLAETVLLSLAHHKGSFSVGMPTFSQTEYITRLARQFSGLGFRPADDHCFGKLIGTFSSQAYALQSKTANPTLKTSLV